MSAIITQNFRLDTTQRFVDGLTNSTYYIGLGRPNPWPLSDDGNLVELPTLPFENDGTTNRVWQEVFAVKKLSSNDIIYSAPRETWASGRQYTGYDDQHENIEGTRFAVITASYSVYICLYAPDGVLSVSDPDMHVGTTTTAVKTPDNYIWKYLYTIPVAIANKFLTTEFIPVQRLDSDPGTSAAQALQDQWSVQDAAVAGEIYSVVVEHGGSGYSDGTFSVTFNGNGTGAAGTALVEGNIVTSITIDGDGSNLQKGLNYDTVTVTADESNTTPFTARAVLSPRGGFGYDPRYDLRAHYVSFNKVFDGDESGSIPAGGVEFRQISLIKNPLEADGTTAAAAETYNTCKSLTGSVLGGFGVGDTISATDNAESGAKGIVVEWDANTKTVYYIQNQDTGFTPFDGADTVTAYDQNGGNTQTNWAIDSMADSAVKFNSGEIMFVENRDKVVRGDTQIETIRLVIEF